MYHFVDGFQSEKKFGRILGYSILGFSLLSLVSFIFFRNQFLWSGVFFGVLTLIAILVFLGFLYSSHSQNALTLQKRELQKTRKGQLTERTQFRSEIDDIERKIRSAQQSAEKQRQTRTSLFEQKARQFQTRRDDIQIHQEEELDGALEALQERYYEQQVQANPIIEAKIPGLGAKTKQSVNNAGIYTIRDVDYARLLAISGIGEKTASNIMAWARDVEQRITYSLPQQIPDADYNVIAAKYAEMFAEVESDEEQEEKDYASDIETIEESVAERLTHFDSVKSVPEANLAAIESSILESDKTLSSYAEITYVNYVKNVFTTYIQDEKQTGRFGILAVLIGAAFLTQTVSAVSSINSIIISNIHTPTSTLTYTPTAKHTSTRTVTPSPSRSSSPSITLAPSITFTPSETPTPSATFPSISQLSCIPSGNEREVGYVTSVTDGDTIKVRIEGTIYPVRYIGVDSPEPPGYFSYDATLRNSQLVEGKWVTLVRDASDTDKFDRLLRYVIVEDIFVNRQLVLDGVATSVRYSPDTSCNGAFDLAQSSARSGKAGFWAPTSTPVPTSVPVPTSAISVGSVSGGSEDSGGGGNCNPSYPSVCLDKAGDYDCASGSGNGPNYVSGPIVVLPPDPYKLDGDHDGVGCE